MNKSFIQTSGVGAALLAVSAMSFGHGFVESPGARNYFCGAVTKPDEVANGTAKYPACGDAFAGDFNSGYSYMSVLNHHQGRKVLGPVAKNVCSFDSETFQGSRTPWDKSINWPVNNISGGSQVFTWNISNGPHFDDSSDFRYWITKPGFVYQVGRELTWADFEDQPFCDLPYNDDNPSAYPNVRADKAAARVHTTCTLPSRAGRHVVYAEWGREPPTYERFHGCIDVQIGGSGNNSSTSAVSSSRSSVTPSSTSRSSVAPSSASRSSVAPSSRPSSSSASSRPSSAASSSAPGNTAGLSCTYVVTNSWGTGFTGAIRVTNTGTSSRTGWAASWQYAGSNRITNAWNSTFSGSNPYSASNLGWNGTLAGGQSVEFGFQGNTNGGAVETPAVSCR